MHPVVALVGRPNVGKSTLFNRLTRSRGALVADEPGVTRDRIYGTAEIERRALLIVDTGGLGADDAGLSAAIAEQARLAAEQADIVLFVVDGRAGLTAADESIAAYLRRLGKPLLVVVNKAESLDSALAAADFQCLGLGECHVISAEHGQGIPSLLEAIIQRLPMPAPQAEAESEGSRDSEERRIRVALVGRPNVGKSTLINRLLGEERVLASDQPGTTRDAVMIPFEAEGARYTLIDTAGVRRRSRVTDKVEKFSIVKSLQTISAAHVVILLIDAQEGVTDQDATLAGIVADSGRAMLLAINKWDHLDADQRRRVERELDLKLGFVSFVPTHYISALHGSGVGNLLRAASQAYQAATKQISTPRLTRILHDALKRHPPPTVAGRRIRLRYAHQGGQNPPTIVIHGNQTDDLPQSYQRYLVNAYRKALALEGTPVRVELRSGRNPYVAPPNKEGPGAAPRRRGAHYLRRRRP